MEQGFGNTICIFSLADGLIGGTAAGSGNVITDNKTGVQLGEGNAVQGNLIDTFADGSAAFGNGTGVRITGSGNRIGGLGEAEGNRIAFNQLGVTVTQLETREGAQPAQGNSVLSNAIYANRLIDVDLGEDGITGNDFQDGDARPNALQNFPVIAAVERTTSSTTVRGFFNSTPSAEFTLQFFATAAGANPGQTVLGTRVVTANEAGDSFRVPVAATAANTFITASATSAAGDTSELFPQNGRSELANISTRGEVRSGDDSLIAGFILSRSGGTRSLLIRALGPSLQVAGAVSDPELLVFDERGQLVAANASWRDTQEKSIRETGLAPADDLEAAVLTTLFTGSYTVQARGRGGAVGIGTVEVYALGTDPAAGQLLNVSTRGRVGTDDRVLVGRLIVEGSALQKVIVRAIGPDLAGQDVPAPCRIRHSSCATQRETFS